MSRHKTTTRTMTTSDADASASPAPGVSAATAAAATDESDVYDRQIRLWGAEAQNKMSTAKVLYVHVTGSSSEVLKNLVLAGVHATICDGRPYPDAVSETPSSLFPATDRCGGGSRDGCGGGGEEAKDDGSQPPDAKKVRRATVSSVVRSAVSELNPLLGGGGTGTDDGPPIDERPVDDIPSDYFAGYDVVVASRLDVKNAKRIASAVSSSGGTFVWVDAFGLNGVALFDRGSNFEYRKEAGRNKWSDPIRLEPSVRLDDMIGTALNRATDRWNKVPPKEYVMWRSYRAYEEATGKRLDGSGDEGNVEEYVRTTKKWLTEQLNDGNGASYDDDELRRWASVASAEVSPVCAVLGGMVGNEVLKSLTGKGEPANNVLLFDGTDGGCKSFVLRG